MTDTRAATTILEDVTSAAGRPLHAAVAGDASAGKNAHGAFIGTDPSGNLQYASLNANRELRVSLEQGDTTDLAANGTTTGNAAYQDVVTVTLANNKTYNNVEWIAGCYRDAEFRIVSVDNGVSTTQAQGILVGQGKLTDNGDLGGLTFISGATGAQTLKLQGKNQNTLSDFKGTITVDEIEQV